MNPPPSGAGFCWRGGGLMAAHPARRADRLGAAIGRAVRPVAQGALTGRCLSDSPLWDDPRLHGAPPVAWSHCRKSAGLRMRMGRRALCCRAASRVSPRPPGTPAGTAGGPFRGALPRMRCRWAALPDRSPRHAAGLARPSAAPVRPCRHSAAARPGGGRRMPRTLHKSPGTAYKPRRSRAWH